MPTWGDVADNFPITSGLPADGNIWDEGSGGSVYGEAPPWWAVLGPGIIAGSSATLSNIFRRYPEQPQTTYRPPTYGVEGATYRNTSSGGVGIGFDSSGLRLSDGSHISWIVIAAVVFGFFLLQSPGFSRRRNPAARKRNPKRRRGVRARRNRKAVSRRR
jgi:hypothetical protein